MGKTILEKIWDHHVVTGKERRRNLLYIDRHMIYEVTSAPAFEMLSAHHLDVRRPDLTYAIMDHNIPTTRDARATAESVTPQLQQLRANTDQHKIQLFDLSSPHQGITHIVAAELSLVEPGMTVACGDSHTCTLGAFGTLAVGVGTSEVFHILATQCLWESFPDQMRITLTGRLPTAVGAKDIMLWLIGSLGPEGARGRAVEYGGSVVSNLKMEERMTLCNMSVELGARTGVISPDFETVEYCLAHRGDRSDQDSLGTRYLSWATDADAIYPEELTFDVSGLEPQVTWGTNPGMVGGITSSIPSDSEIRNRPDSTSVFRALEYMGLEPGTDLTDITIDRVFIGSCSNSTLTDLRRAASVVKGRHVHPDIRAMVVPGSQRVKQRAEAEGLRDVFVSAGFEWREPGCSMCVALNADRLKPYERCASTSNRNFEGRQGANGRTHLVSPEMAAAAAIYGRFVDVSELREQFGLADHLGF